MKIITLALLIASLAACGQFKNDSPSKDDESAPMQGDRQADVALVRIFSDDRRPQDGSLRELSLGKLGSKYEVTLRTVTNGRQSPPVDTTETLGSKLECTIATEKISCKRDARPMDDVLTEIILVKSNNGWSASRRTAYYNRAGRQSVDETKQLGSDFIETKEPKKN